MQRLLESLPRLLELLSLQGFDTGAGASDVAGVATTAELSAGVVASSAYTCPAKKAGANRAVDKTGNKERLFILKSFSFLFSFILYDISRKFETFDLFSSKTFAI